jgi:hypothetical protein
MRDETAVESGSGSADAGDIVASPETCESITDILDAVHRSSFEAWWARAHRSAAARESAPAARHGTRYP